MGHAAWHMIGRTPGHIVAVRPLRGGAITDFEITQRLIRLLFQQAGITRLQRARVLVCVPSAHHPRRAAGRPRGDPPRRRVADLPHRAAHGRGDRRVAADPRAARQHGRRHRRRHERGRGDLAGRHRRARRPYASAPSTSTARSRRTCAASTTSRSVSAQQKNQDGDRLRATRRPTSTRSRCVDATS